jgi:hypothetical protein
MTDEEKAQFRGLRGNQGHATGLRHAQAFIQQRIPAFEPKGLAEFLELEKARTNDTAISRINEIERLVCRIAIGALKAKSGADDDSWWYQSVPRNVRTAATSRQEDDQNRRGAKENYLDFIDYRDIIQENWVVLGELLSPGKQNQNKATRTAWMNTVNDIRKIAAHGSSAVWVSFEQLEVLNDRLAVLREVHGEPQVVPVDSETDS